MFRFILKIALFSLPVTLIFLFPAFVFFVSREHYSLEREVSIQARDHNTLAGKAFTDLNGDFVYKKLLVETMKPEIVTLGSSKTLEFRKEFFSSPGLFVNAAIGGASMEKIELQMRSLSNSGVKVVILGVDQRWFRPENSFPSLIPDGASGKEMFVSFMTYYWRKIYFDYARGRFNLRELVTRSMHTEHIGLTALINHDGFRGDGSYRFGFLLEDPEWNDVLRRHIDADIEALKRDRLSSEDYGSGIRPGAVEGLDRILTYAKEYNISVIGYVPPLAPDFYRAALSLDVDDPYRKSVFAVSNAIRTVFSDHGLKVYDFTDPSALGGKSDEFLSSNHPTDKWNLRMLVYLAQREDVLRKYVDIKKAQSMLKETSADFLALDL